MSMTLIDTWDTSTLDYGRRIMESAEKVGISTRELKVNTIHTVIDGLLEIRNREDDWDGMGGIAPTPETVDSAILLLRLLDKEGMPVPSNAVAGPNSSVLLVWEIGSVYLEAELSRPYFAEWMLEVPGLPPRHWAGNEIDDFTLKVGHAAIVLRPPHH